MKENSTCPNLELINACFGLLSKDEWDRISIGQRVTTYKKGELILKQGIVPNYVLFITEGYALKYIETEEGRSVNVDILREGDFIGIQTVLSVTSCNYSIQALSELKACSINLAILKSLVETNISFTLKLLKRAAEDENALMLFHTKLTYKQMSGKLAQTLLFLTENRNSDLNVFGLLSRKDIANFAGISHINATKILKEFEKEGVIKLDGKDIYIIDRKRLEYLSQIG